MASLWFLIGVLVTVAAVGVLLPWLRTTPRLAFLSARPWAASLGAIAVVAAAFALYRGLGNRDAQPRQGANASSDAAASGFGQAANAFGSATGERVLAAPSGAQKTPADSMETAIAKLQARLAKAGGTDGDWELLAKSFEFVGRPEDAAKARSHQLSALPAETIAGAGGAEVSGEVSLAPALAGKVTPGETLFIVARSVDAPGMPVAVLKTSVGSWPLKFKLDDSLSMLPGRNLSSAGAVTIVAHVSRKGQPIPASGDLQGVTGIVDPGDSHALNILIDQIIR